MREIDRIGTEYIVALTEKGFDADGFIAAALSDRDIEGMPVSTALVLTHDGLAVISGTITARVPASRHAISADGRSEFRQTYYAFYATEDFDSLIVDELISGVRLVGKKDDKYTLICCGSFTAKDSLVTLARIYTAVVEGRELPPAEERDSKYCPKCGRRYADVDRKICPHCMDKSALVHKMWFFLRKYKVHVALILLTLVSSGALSIFAPYISSGFYYDEVLTAGGRFYGQLLFVISIILGTRLLTLAVNIVNGIITARVSNKLVCDLRKVIFSSIERLSVSFFSSRQTGGLMSQVDNDSEAIYWLFCDGLPYYLINLIQVVSVFIIMLFMKAQLALVSVITAPLAIFIYIRLYKHSRKLHARRWIKRRRMNGILSDALSGVRVVKAFAKEGDEVKRFGRANTERMLADRESSLYNSTAFPFANLLLQMSTFLVWGFGGWMVINSSDAMSYGMLLTFISYVGMLTSPLFTLADMTFELSNSMNSIQRMSEIIDATPDVYETPHPTHIGSGAGSIEFRDVSFSYVKNRTVLDHMSFFVPASGRVGIVGHTGAGKSTVANLILRLYDADEGEVLIDGINVKDLSFEDIRKKIAIVSQEIYLFYGTVFDNIRYARPDATYDEVIAASKTAGAHDFIMKLDDGYDTMLGFGHRDLSGGERQRVSIARALLHDPGILILDEATSAMDTQTEMKIQSAIDKLSRGRTTVTIAHRLSTLRGSDELYVVDNGKITEHGTHEELLALDGTYKKLYTLQAEAQKNIVLED